MSCSSGQQQRLTVIWRVAYALLDPSSTSVPDPKNIQKWLGPSNTRLDDKVPTELIYTDRLENVVDVWGSHCRNKHVRRYAKHSFKLSIASKAKNVAAYGHDTNSARKYFKDYITEVCAYVEDCLTKWVPKYRSLRVEFIFSVPVTWEFDTETLNEVKSTVRGIVGVSQTRRAEIGLTEAAAAAVDIGRNKFEKGDVILVCDVSEQSFLGTTTIVHSFQIRRSCACPLILKTDRRRHYRYKYCEDAVCKRRSRPSESPDLR
jgi:hypothetical protein